MPIGIFVMIKFGTIKPNIKNKNKTKQITPDKNKNKQIQRHLLSVEFQISVSRDEVGLEPLKFMPRRKLLPSLTR